MTMRIQRLKNGMYQVVESDSTGETFVFDEFSKKWLAQEYIDEWKQWEEEWEKDLDNDDEL